MRAVAEGVSLGGRLFGKGFEVGDFKGEMSQIGTDLHGAAGIILADLDLFVAFRSLEEDELGAAPALAAADFLKSEDIPVEGYGFFQIMNPVTGVKQFGDHAIGSVTEKDAVTESFF